MNHRRIALIVGVLYIVASMAGLIGLVVLEDPVLNVPDYLANVAGNEGQLFAGVLLELVMGVSVVGIALAVYPVLAQRNASAAVGYVAARLLEFSIYIVGAVSLLSLVTLSREFVAAGSPAASPFHTQAELLLATRDWGGHVVLDVAVFPLGALLLYAVLYRYRLVPRWISGLGLVAAPLCSVAGLLVLFEAITPLTTGHVLLQAPLGVQEMVLAVWLIVKGFSPAAAAAGNWETGPRPAKAAF